MHCYPILLSEGKRRDHTLKSRWNALESRWNRAGIDSATRQIYMKGSHLYNLILHTEWKELKVCEVVVRLLQRIGWLQGKICRGWTLDFGKSKFWTAHYEIGVTANSTLYCQITISHLQIKAFRYVSLERLTPRASLITNPTRNHWHLFPWLSWIQSFLNCAAAACSTIERCYDNRIWVSLPCPFFNTSGTTLGTIFTVHRTSLAETHAAIEAVGRELSTRDGKESMIIHICQWYRI